MTSDRHALVIGIDAYSNGIPPLGSAVKDAQAVADRLANEHGYAVTTLLDADATVAAITQFLDQQIPSQLSVDTPFLIYFAGHGVAEGETGAHGPEGYLVLHDAVLANSSTWYPMDTLRTALNALACRHLLVVLDCCYAGAFQWATATRDIGFVQPPTLYQSVYDRYMSGEAWQALTSAAANQVAADSVTGFANLRGTDDQGHSPFAAALIDGLAGGADTSIAGFGADGVITATELYQYISTCLMPSPDAATAQTPGIWPLKPDNVGEYVFLNPKVTLQTKPDPPLDDTNNPWLGLAAYSAATRDLFFGRQAATDELLARVEARGKTGSLLAVVGASGTGKSSLVQAGLVPSLGARTWAVVQSAPLTGDPRTALDDARKALAAAPRGRRRLLVIDQLEDLYTQCPDGPARAGFLKGLRELIDTRSGPTVVVTLRSDFEPRAVDDESLGDIWQKARYEVPPFSSDELRQVLEGPMRVKAMFFEPANVEDDLFDEVNAMPGALPLLSFALTAIYRQSQVRRQKSGSGDRYLSRADYEAVGGVAGALNRRATQLYDEADDTDKAMIERVFLRLVSQDGAGLTGRRVEKAELQFGVGDDEVQQCVDRVVQKTYVPEGLLVVGSDAGGDFVEPAHDALIVQWQELHDWLQASHSQELIRAAWRAASVWNAGARASGYLWSSDPRLPQLAASAQAGDLNQLERAFLAASARRKRIRKERIVGTTAAVMATLLVATLVALVQRSHAIRSKKSATSLALTAIARTPPASNLDNALLLNLDAYLASPTLQARNALLTGLEEAPQEILHGGGGIFTGVAFSPDGRTVAAAGDDGTVRLWDRAAKTELGRPLPTHQTTIWGLAFSPLGRMVATAGANGTVRLWDVLGSAAPVPTLRGLPPVNGDDPAYSVAFSPSGHMVAAGYNDGRVLLWRLPAATAGDPPPVVKPEVLWRKPKSGPLVVAVAFNRAGNLLAAARGGGTVRVWKVGGGKARPVPALPPCGECELNALAFNRDGSTLAAGSDSGVVLWDVTDPAGSAPRPLKGSGGTVYGVAFSADGRTFATAGGDGEVRLWKVRGGTPVGRPGRPLTSRDGPLYSVAFSPSGDTVAAAGADGAVRLWDVLDPQIDRHLGDRGRVDGVAFAPGCCRSSAGQDLLAAAGDNGTLRLWNVRANARLAAPRVANEPRLSGIAFSPDGRLLAAAGDRRVDLWTIGARPRAHETVAGTPGIPISSVAFSPNGRTLAVGGGSVRLWDVAARPPTGGQTLAGAQGLVTSLAFSPDGRLLAAGYDDGSVWVWNGRGWPSREPLGKALVPQVKGKAVMSVSFSPDGRLLTASYFDGTVRFWRTNTLRPAGGLLRAAAGSVDALAFSPDGSMFATAGYGGTVRLWDVRTRAPLGLPLQAHAGLLHAVAFSPDGRTLAAGGNRGTVIWETILWADRADLISRVCGVVVGNLTPAQWTALVPGLTFRTACPG